MARVFCVGHAVQDFVFAVERLPERAEKHRATAFESVGGGPAATAAVAIAKLGGAAQLAARVGSDGVADLMLAELDRYGVDCTHVRRLAGCGSSVSAVLLDARGERLIVNHLDPRMPADPGWLPAVSGLGADAVLGDTRWPEGAAHALRQARELGIPAVLDADRPIPPDGTLLAAATHVAFSAEGLRELTAESDARRALAAVAAKLDAWCCVTVGAEGCWSIEGGALEHHPAPRVRVVDTLGAGDVWHGAFALALAERRKEREAIAFANAAAALKVRSFGGRAGAPSRAQLERFVSGREGKAS